MTESSILSIISARNRNTLGKYDIFLPILFLVSFKPLKKCYCKNSPMLVTYHCYFGTMLLFFCFQMFTEDGIFLYFQFLNIPNVSEKWSLEKVEPGFALVFKMCFTGVVLQLSFWKKSLNSPYDHIAYSKWSKAAFET